MTRCAVLSELPGYVIRSDGKIQGPKGKWLKPNPTGTHREYGQITTYVNGVKANKLIHVLVAIAFLGDAPSSTHQVRHLNGDSWDNRIENLAWGTPTDNMQDRIKHGNNPNLNKTKCKWGHFYSEENTIHRKKGGRDCRTCAQARDRARYPRKVT